MKSKQTWIKAAIYTFIILLPFGVFYWQIPFISKTTIGNDYVAYAIQNQLDLQYSMKHGTFPLYVTGYGGGQAAAAMTMGQIFHPIFYVTGLLPGYWDGNALLWNTLFRLIFLGIAQLALFILLRRLRVNLIFSFIISFITVYNMRMLDLFRYGSSLENYTGGLLLCAALAFYYMKPTRFRGPAYIIASTYLLICGGHPQQMYLASIGVFIVFLAIPFIIRHITGETEEKHPSPLKYYLAAGASMLTGILLSSAYIIPFYKDVVLNNAPRVGQDYQWSLSFSDTLGGLLNSFFNPLHGDVHGAFGSSPVIILFALIPILYIIRKKAPLSVIALWVAMVLVFLCALGQETQVHYYFWKYVPLANVFRCPPRITVVLPFIFLLVSAWMFRNNEEKARLFLASIAIPVYILYHTVWVKTLPKPGPYTPSTIQALPSWVEPALFWIGMISLILIALHSLHIKRFANSWRVTIGILLAITVVTQGAVQIRRGTWMTTNYQQTGLKTMEKQKQADVSTIISVGATMETAAVFQQRKHSIIEPELAKFYREYELVENQRQAYGILSRRNVTEKVVVEATMEQRDRFDPNTSSVVGYDWLVLKENTYNRLEFIANAGAPGFFAFSFPFTKQWRATVDGGESPIYRANGYMQAVYLLPGQHKIEFRYWSDAAFTGMITSCATFLIMGIFFAFFAFGKKKKLRTTAIIISLILPAGIFAAWRSSLYSGDNLKTNYTWNTKQLPPTGNLAYAKKTYMSTGDYDLNYAGLGVDGNYGRSFKTDLKKNQWWQVDLGSPKKLGEVLLHDRSFKGKEQLPLRLLGSIDGKEFQLMKEITDRGQGVPWRIPMQGEITRFLRLQTPSKASVSFSEVEVYPHPDALNGSPQTEFVKTEPILEEDLNKITWIRQAVIKGDSNAVKSYFSSGNKLGTDIKSILTYEALSKAFEKRNTQVVGMLRNIGAQLPFCVTDAEPGNVIDILMSPGIRSIGDRELSVWKNDETQMEKISPSLLKIAEIGTFKFEVIKNKKPLKNSVVLRNVSSEGEERRLIQFGYDLGKVGLDKIPGGRYINFIVKASIPPRLIQDEKYVNSFIISQNLDGKWENKRISFMHAGMRTQIVSLKIKAGAKQVLALIQFNPQTPEDELRIEDIRIIINEKPL